MNNELNVVTTNPAREILETIWDLEDLHRELISRIQELIKQ